MSTAVQSGKFAHSKYRRENVGPPKILVLKPNHHEIDDTKRV